MERVRVILNLFMHHVDIEYTIGYLNLNDINTIQELFDAVYNLLDQHDLYHGYVYLLDFNVTIILKSYSPELDLEIFKNAFIEDSENYIYARTIFEFLDSNPIYRNREYLTNWFDSDNKVRDSKLYSLVKYGHGTGST